MKMQSRISEIMNRQLTMNRTKTKSPERNTSDTVMDYCPNANIVPSLVIKKINAVIKPMEQVMSEKAFCYRINARLIHRHGRLRLLRSFVTDSKPIDVASSKSFLSRPSSSYKLIR